MATTQFIAGRLAYLTAPCRGKRRTGAARTEFVSAKGSTDAEPW